MQIYYCSTVTQEKLKVLSSPIAGYQKLILSLQQGPFANPFLTSIESKNWRVSKTYQQSLTYVMRRYHICLKLSYHIVEKYAYTTSEIN